MVVITFKGEGEMPLNAMSLGSTRYNKTGTWRSQRPGYMNRIPPCNHACPAGEDIVDYLQMVVCGDWEKAKDRILLENPLIGVTGRVCPHPCETECNRGKYDEAIAIHDMERFLSDLEGKGLPMAQKTASEGAKVAIIGSGPAGLSCAYQLARHGYDVTIFEALPVTGGMLRVGIPPYHLPREVLDREIEAIIKLGVKIKTGMCLGRNLSFDDLKEYKAIFLAVGQHVGRRLEIPGEDAEGVLSGLEFLRKANMGEKVEIGKNIAVIGGGNTAKDASRVAIRLGAKKVTILYRRTRMEMPALEEEIRQAEEEGVVLEFLTAPIEIIKKGRKVAAIKCVRMQLGEPDRSGRRFPRPIPGSEYTLEMDTVISAVGQSSDFSFVKNDIQVKDGFIVVDNALQTSRRGTFAGGDAATGEGTVTHAVGSGKRGAIAIDRFLRGESLEEFPPLNEYMHVASRRVESVVVPFEEINLDYFNHEGRIPQKHRKPQERKKDFKEASFGYSREDALREAMRCFSCGTCNGCDNCWLFCPDVSVRRDASHKNYEFDYDYCKGCGICAEECPRECIAMSEEVR